MASLGGVCVNVIEARGILAADAGGTSDPYVTITLLNSKGAVMAAGGTFKTAVIKKTLTPQWNESFIVGDKLDLRTVTTLRLLLRDSDGAFMSDNVLGVVDIPATYLLTELKGPLDNWFQLTKHEKMKKDSKGELHLVLERLEPEESLAGRGTGVNIDPGLEMKPAASSEPPNLLYVTLKSGNNLLGMDNNGTTSDPIVFFTFNGQKHESTKKERTLKPQWNEKFGFFATDLKNKLSILVEDYDITINDFMGKADVSLKDLKPNVEKTMNVELGGKKGKKDKQERGYLELKLLWTFDKNARDIAAKRKKSNFLPTFGAPDQDYNSDDDEGMEIDEIVSKKSEEEMKKERAEKAEKQAALVSELSSFEIKSGDYNVQVHVIEARDLVPKDSTGTSDPVVYVEVFGEKQQTAVKKQVLSCFWDDLLIFPFRNLDKAEVEMGYVRLSVMDANTLQRAELIGAAQFDVSYIYSQANHQLANVWIGLTDITNTTNQGIQGYLRASISIIGPGDKLVPPPSPFGEGASTDMNDVIMPPSVTQHVRFLGAIIHVAEHLPPMDVAVVGRGGLDAYVKGAIAGGDPIRTRVRTKKGRRDELCPSFNEELMLVIREPSMADSIQLAVYDWDQVGSDELVGYVYQSVKLVKAMGGKIGPFWANIYGAPLRLKTVGIGDSMKKQMNTYPDIASTYRGRLLLTLRILDNDGSLDETNQKRNIKRVPRDLYPREAIYRLRAHFIWGSQIPSFLSSKRPGQKAKMQLVMSCGLYEIASTRTRNMNGTVEWNNMVESDKMLLPEDLSQVPDIFLYLCKGDGDTRKAVCFRRYTAKELFEGRPSRDGDNGIMGGFNNELDWVSMKEDQALDSLEDETFPGNVLVRVGFGTEEMAMQTAWNRSDMDAVNKRVPYQLRVHIYQGRRLPPADSNGLLDPFLVVRCMGEEKLTSKKKKTRDPLWYETLHFDVNLPDLKYAPQVMLRVMDFDDFDTNDFVGLAALNLSEAHIRTSDEVSGEHQPSLPDPKWHRILFQEPGDCEGEILASLELVRKQFPDETVRRAPSIVPRNRKAFLEITVLGLRNMEPYQFLPIQLPYIEFVLGGKDHAAQEMITEKSKRPSGSNPNFLQRIVKEIDLPENAHFAPRLNIIVKDTRLGGFQKPIIGSASIEMSSKIPWSKHYKPPQEDTLAEIELESADEWDDDAPLLGRKAKLDDSPSLESVDNGAGVFGALKSMGVEFDPNGAFEEASSRRSTIAGEEDDPDAKKYLKHRELLDSELESELKTTPFEKYGLHIGQKKKKSSLLAAFNPFAKKNRVVGDDVGMYKMAGYFKGLIRVIEREDEKPLLDFDTLLQTLPYEVRIYVLDGVGFAPMDIGLNGRPGKSDPYLRLKLGDKKISDRKNYIEDTTDPDFYKMFMFNAKLPGASILTIEAMDHDLIGGDDLIGKTTIDLEDRLFDRRWQAMGKMYETTSRLRLKPLETRTLNIPTSRAPMGTIKLWVDVLNPAQAHDYPAIDISLPPPVDMELRVVVWKARNVPSFDTLEDMNDLFFRCWMEGSDYQETDIHWRAKKGKGSFNWRMKFPLTLGHKQTNTKIPYFHIQGWDKDVLSANDAIGEHTLNLKPFFQRAYKTKTNVQVYEDDEETKKKKKKATSDDDAAVKKIKEATGLWDDDDPADSKWLKLESLDHKTNTRQFMGEVCVSLELVPAENANKNPVGQGRSSPNNSPYLPPPAGRLSFSLNPFKVLNDLLGPSICHRLTCCFCCILFMVLVYFLAPFINVAIITLKGYYSKSQGEGQSVVSADNEAAGVMPRRANRVGVEVESQKGEEEPHTDSSIIDGDGSSRSMKSSRSAPSLEAAKAQRQKELLRKKKAERRAHAKQRMAEKQQRSDEKKQTWELLQMLEEDVPAVDLPQVLIDSSTSIPSFKVFDTEAPPRQDAATSVEDPRYHEMEISGTESLIEAKQEIPVTMREAAGQTEIVPKKLTNSTPTKSTNAAASTIQKALKKNYKKCKKMFRQSPRVFAEERLNLPAQDEVTPPAIYDDDDSGQIPLTDAATQDNSSPPERTIETAPSPEREELRKSIVPPLVLPEIPPGTPPRTLSSSSSCSSACSCSSYSCSCSCSSATSSASEADSRHRRSSRSKRTSRTERSVRDRRRKSRRHTGRSSRSHSHRSSGPPSSLLSLLWSEQSRKYGEVHHFMATRIQARMRGVIGRDKARRRRVDIDEELKEEALHELQEEAVIKIQTRTRGVLARKKMPISDKERRRRRRRRSQLNSVSPSRFSEEEPNVEQMGVYADPDEVGEWPKEIDLEPLDDWQELNQPATVSGDTVTESQFLSVGMLRVFCGTWNMHAKKPTDDLRLWIRLNKYHIVAVGSEECVNSIAKSVVFTSKKSWEDQLRSTLGDDYILVAAHALTAIHNIVFVHSSILPLLGNIQSDAVATGLGNQLGNKGGVGIAFTIGATSFAFINSHFEAHQRNVSKRNGNFHRINHELRLSPTGAISSPTNGVSVAPSPVGAKGETLNGLGRTSANRFSMPTVVGGVGGGAKRTISERFDRVFWYGDLNYRINGTRRMVDTLLLRNQYEVLYANDQLQREMTVGNVFAHFREGPPHFRPTYKFDKRSDTYDSSSKQRIPSWTDRVLYLSNDKVHDIELLSYRSQTAFRTSDHRPVCAVFQVNFKAAGTVDFLQSPRPSASSDHGLPDENRATSQACTLQ